MPKLLIFDAFTLLICENKDANYALLQCKTFSLKIWLCKILDKYHVCSKFTVHLIIGHRFIQDQFFCSLAKMNLKDVVKR